MLSLMFAVTLAFESHAFTERFTCARQGARLLDIVVRGRGRLPVTREVPATAHVAELRVGKRVQREVVLQGVAGLSAAGTYFELDAVNTDLIAGLFLTSFGPAAIVDERGRRFALDCGDLDLLF